MEGEVSTKVEYPRLPQEEYDNALGHFKMQLNGVFHVFCCHGLDAYVPGAIEAVVDLAEQFSMRVRGKDAPIQLRFSIPDRPTA